MVKVISSSAESLFSALALRNDAVAAYDWGKIPRVRAHLMRGLAKRSTRAITKPWERADDTIAAWKSNLAYLHNTNM